MKPVLRARMKETTVEMIQWSNNEPQIREFIKDDRAVRFPDGSRCLIWNSINDDWMQVPMFNWIVKGVKGELYTISPEVKESTFEIISEEEQNPNLPLEE